MKRTVLITGAAGNIGGKLAAHWRETGTYELRLLDIAGGDGIVAADLAVWDRSWAQAFAGVDTVIHLAAQAWAGARWEGVVGPNVIATQHVLRAAREAGVRRVIFASTVQVMMGHRFGEAPIRPDTPPAPLSPYAISKLMGEFMGRAFNEETGASFIAFRVGYFQRGDNLPGPWMKIGAFGQSLWLSNRDMIQAMEKAVEVENVPYAVLHLASANPGSRFDISETRRVLGYVPQDGHEPEITPELVSEDETARAARIPPGMWFDEYFVAREG